MFLIFSRLELIPSLNLFTQFYKMASKRKVKDTGLAFVLVALFLFVFYVEWEFYLSWVQGTALIIAAVASIVIFSHFAVRKKYVKSLLGAVLPWLAYDVVNYSKEAIYYGTHLYEIKGELSQKILALMSINLSLADLKIVFALIAIILWCLAWEKVSG